MDDSLSLSRIAWETNTAYSFHGNMASQLPANSARAANVLSKAVTRAARLLDIRQAKLADILGISAATASRLVAGDYELQPNRKEWELAALFVRIFRSLDALMGHGGEAHTWLNSRNRALGDTPAELLASAEGLVRVLHYLDAYRGRV